jgi:hypothetical protein
VLAFAALVAAPIGLAIMSFYLHSDTYLSARVFLFLISGMTGLGLAWCAVAVMIRLSWKAARIS